MNAPAHLVLSTRLRTLAELVLPGGVVADVGTDHALLPAWLLEHGRAKAVIATDIAAGPLRAAARHADAREALSLRRGDGLAPLEPGEVDSVVIAGMGGRRIAQILNAAPEVVARLRQLVLQPNTDWTHVRELVATRGWRLVDERLVEDAGQFYLMLDIRCDERHDAAEPWTPRDLEFGPHLRHRRDPTFLRWLEQRRADLLRAREKLAPHEDEQPQRVAELETALQAVAEEAGDEPAKLVAASRRSQSSALDWWRTRWQLVRHHASVPSPLPQRTDPSLQIAYGVAQPFFGLMLLLREKQLRNEALGPVVIVAGICAVVAWFGGDGSVSSWLRVWWVTLFGIAALPPLLFARSYARIAASVRNGLGLGPAQPYYKSGFEVLKEWFSQAFILAIGIAPLTLVVALLPTVGDVAATALAAGWTLHWMMVEGLDGAKSRNALDTQLEHTPLPDPRPWFLRWLMLPMPGWASLPLLPSRIMARFVASMSRQWSPELRLIERSPWEAVGFGLGTVALLAIPGINLVFRPAVVAGGAHLRARLEQRAVVQNTPDAS